MCSARTFSSRSRVATTRANPGSRQAGDTDVNAEMVRTGTAWAYRAQLKDRSLLDLEAVAREFKRGLWALHKTEQQPLWEWRKEMRSARR